MEPGEFTEKEDKGKEITNEEKTRLYGHIEELKRSNAFLRAENDMFENFISRIDPRDLVPQNLGEAPPGFETYLLEVEGRGKRLRTQSNTPDRLQQLSLGQKHHLAQGEVEKTRQDLGKLQHHSERIQNNYKAVLEEADVRLAEIQRARFEFERDVVKPLKEKKGEMVGAENVLHYIEERINTKTQDTQIEKLRLKNQALKAHVRKLRLQLQQKKDMEETLNQDNLQQLKIENIQYQEKLDERNQELLRLKLLAANTQKSLNSYKNKLHNATCESKELGSDITKRKELLAKIEKETQQFEKECSKAEALTQSLRSQLSDYSVPDVLEYMWVKDKHKKLQCTFHASERKVEISEMVLKTHIKASNREKADLVALNNTESGASPGKRLSVLKLPNMN